MHPVAHTNLVHVRDAGGRLRKTRVRAVAVCCAATFLAAISSAHADSIVYIKGHDVWVASPDGSRDRRVTSNGTAGVPYASPLQSRDGTIVAQRGFRFQRLLQSGRL